jgi:hypothetical protein
MKMALAPRKAPKPTVTMVSGRLRMMSVGPTQFVGRVSAILTPAVPVALQALTYARQHV